MRIYEYIDPGSSHPGLDKLAEFENVDSPLIRYFIYKSDEHVIINNITLGKDLSIVGRHQVELPIKSCSWIADVIENGFWKLPSEGGFPKNKHGVTAKFAEEEVGVSRSMNAGTDQPGFRIVNKSRKSPGLEFFWPQSISFSDAYFEKYLLSILRSL